jgi:hypothetical protein
VRICYVRIRVKDKRTMFPVTFLSHTRRQPLACGARFRVAGGTPAVQR